MNYAEDRLDRRARMINLIENGSMSQSDEGVFNCESYPPTNPPKSNNIDSQSGFNNKSSLVMDLNQAHSMIHAGMSCSNTMEATCYLKTGHELAGRTLRDCGLCSHASFHYAMAWMCDESDADRAGILSFFMKKPCVDTYHN